MNSRSFVRRSAGLVALALLGAQACSSSEAGSPTPTAPSVPLEAKSPWPKFRGGAAQQGQGRASAKDGAGAPWAYKTDKGIFSSPVIAADGTIYIGSADRTFYALAADGTLSWKLLTGEIIDSSALLDDRGRVYVGSGDGKLRALDARSGSPVWTMSADDPSVNKAFINWFEGNVAIGPEGTLYVPNDNFFVYAIDRDTGSVDWRFKMPDQTWSLPAVDAASGNLYIGNNNLLPLLGKNTFAIGPDGSALWRQASLGTVAASPMLASGRVIVGGFDGYVRAYDAASGDVLWQTGTRDHVYASAALLPNGLIVAPSCDGTIYALDPTNGAVKWAFDTREPVRSSPAVDADGNVYVGTGEGRLYVLNPDGTLRWTMRLIDEDRNDLNSSPALGADAVVLGGESGEVFRVPYDYCLKDGKSDARCSSDPTEPLPAEGAHLLSTTAFGALLDAPPSSIDANQSLAFTLTVRDKGDSRLAILDASSVKVTIDPPSDVTIDVAGDGKFVVLTPKKSFSAGADGHVTIDVSASYLVDLDRVGLKLSGGKPGGTVTAHLTPMVTEGALASFPLPKPQKPGDPSAVWEIARLSLPLPTILPSYNQIGFDSLHYLVGLVEMGDSAGVAWMVGAKLADGENKTVIDPATKAVMPLEVAYDKGLMTLKNEAGLSVEVMNAVIPFQSFRIGANLGADGNAASGARLNGTTVCAKVPTYGQFLEQLGLCNPQTDVLAVVGASYLRPYEGGTATAPSGVGTVAFDATKGAVTATFSGSTLKLAAHAVGLLLIDSATGKPVTLSYGIDTVRTAASDGTLASVKVPILGKTLPAKARTWVVVDTSPVAMTELSLMP